MTRHDFRRKKPSATGSGMAKTKTAKKSPETVVRSRATKSPSVRTVKRLFAISGNRCAFTRCTMRMVDNDGCVFGEICHIKGDKPGAKRYDKSQTDAERQGFDNLILMCPVHHKKIDDDESAYSVETLTRMKAKHESKQQPQEVDSKIVRKLISKLGSTSVVNGSVVVAQGQTGGQTAHSIQNIFSVPLGDDTLSIEGTIEPTGKTGILGRFGTAGIMLTVVNRGKRVAKMTSAEFCVDGTGFLDRFREAFRNKIPQYKPVPGLESETLYATLFELSERNHPEGYVLDRDDVCRFFLPLGPHFGPALKAKANDVYFRVRMFDGSRVDVLRGKNAQAVVRGTVKSYRKWPHKPKGILKLAIEVRASSAPTIPYSLINQTNPEPLWLGEPGKEPPPPKKHKLRMRLGIAEENDSEFTAIIGIGGLSKANWERVNALLCVATDNTQVRVLPLQRALVKQLKSELSFVIPLDSRDTAISVALSVPVESLWISVLVEDTEVFRIDGKLVKNVLSELGKYRKKDDGQS